MQGEKPRPPATDKRSALRALKAAAIVAAARSRFLSAGYDAASLAGIAQAAGVSTRTLYKHYPTKAALFGGVAAGYVAELLAGWDVDLDEQLDLRSQLETMGRSYAELIVRPEAVALFRIVIAESDRFPDLGRVFREQAEFITVLRFSRWLDAMQASGRLTVPDHGLAASLFFGLMEFHLVRQRLISGLPEDWILSVETIVGEVVETFLRRHVRAGADAPS
jgi:AcrR family transcriptional regulator